MAMPSYVIYRNTEQMFDTTAPLEFLPPKDSDELFFALREKYPHLGSHSERMREAVIEFLLEEQATELQLATPHTNTTNETPPWPTFQSMSSDSSTWSSPETLALSTPSFGSSPMPYPYPQAPKLSRQDSTVSSATATQGEQSPPALEQMTSVFSLSESAQPKQRIRRKMTEAEKAEYRKRRSLKACDKCAKRKRKCNHDQSGSETVDPSNKISKSTATHGIVKKHSSPPTTLPKIQEQDLPFDINSVDFADSFAPNEQAAGFDNFVADPFPNISFDDFLNTSPDVQWPWTDEQDWTLMDSQPKQQVPSVPQKTDVQHKFDIDRYNVENYNDRDSMPHALDNFFREEDTRYYDSRRGEQNVSGHNNSTRDGQVAQVQGWVQPRELELPQQQEQPRKNQQAQDALVQATAVSDGARSSPRLHRGGRGNNANDSETQIYASDSFAASERVVKDQSTSEDRRRLQQNDQQQTPQNVKLGASLGEGITSSVSPSMELYMLKRRIPKALHSIVDRDSTANATPLLQSKPQTEPLRNLGSISNTAQVNGGAYPRLVSPTPLLQSQPQSKDARDLAPTNNTVQVNGGAYPRLVSPNEAAAPRTIGYWQFQNPPKSPTANLSTGQGLPHHALVHANAALAAANESENQSQHTDSRILASRNAVVSRAADLRRAELHRQGALSNSSSGQSDTAGTTSTSIRSNVSLRRTDVASTTALTSPATSVVYEDRLHDTVRYRDHFGRNLTLATLGSVLLLLAATPTSTSTALPLLLLALAAPTPCTKNSRHPQTVYAGFPVWGSMVQCTDKNSAWLARMQKWIDERTETAQSCAAKLVERFHKGVLGMCRAGRGGTEVQRLGVCCAGRGGVGTRMGRWMF